MDFHNFPKGFWDLGVYLVHPPEFCAGLVTPTPWTWARTPLRYWGRLVETTTISENGKQVPAWVLKLETMAEDIKSAAAARGQRHGVLSGGDEDVEMLKNRLAR